MAKYILSYSKIDGYDPFEDIITILYNAMVRPETIQSPIESTLIFEFSLSFKNFQAIVEIGEKLKPICHFVLSDFLVNIIPHVDIKAEKLRKERINMIICHLSPLQQQNHNKKESKLQASANKKLELKEFTGENNSENWFC